MSYRAKINVWTEQSGIEEISMKVMEDSKQDVEESLRRHFGTTLKDILTIDPLDDRRGGNGGAGGAVATV